MHRHQTSLISLRPHQCMARHLATRCIHASNASEHYAVIGGGIAGLATTWHLLQHLQVTQTHSTRWCHPPLRLAPGCSCTKRTASAQAAPGLPRGSCTPTRPRARCCGCSCRLHDTASHAALVEGTGGNGPSAAPCWRSTGRCTTGMCTSCTWLCTTTTQAVLHDTLPAAESALMWRTGIVRVASNAKQQTALDAAAAMQPGSLAPLTHAALQSTVPGAVPAAPVDSIDSAALLLRDAVVLHPQRYMRCDGDQQWRSPYQHTQCPVAGSSRARRVQAHHPAACTHPRVVVVTPDKFPSCHHRCSRCCGGCTP